MLSVLKDLFEVIFVILVCMLIIVICEATKETFRSKEYIALERIVEDYLQYDPFTHELPIRAKTKINGKVVFVQSMTKGRGKIVSDHYESYVTDSVLAKNPTEVRYIMYVKEYCEQIGEYTSGSKALSCDEEFVMIDWDSKEIVCRKHFWAGPPPRKKEMPGPGYGVVSYNEVHQWLTSVLENKPLIYQGF